VAEKEVIDNVIATFKSRIKKEQDDAQREAARQKAQRQAREMLAELKSVADSKDGMKADYDLSRFLTTVNTAFPTVPELDPDSAIDRKLLAKVLSIKLIYGSKSKQYAEAVAALNAARDRILATNKNAPPCTKLTLPLARRFWERGMQLVEANKPAEALPLLKQSLQFCLDDRRAKIAAAIEANAGGTASIDGVYAGAMRFPKDAKADGALRLTIDNNNLSGSFSSHTVLQEFTIVVTATIAGKVTADGRIAAAIKGESKVVESTSRPAQPPPRDPNDISTRGGSVSGLGAILARAVHQYPFGGRFDGQVTARGASGSVAAQRPASKKGQPPQSLAGTWKAVPQ
jgi:hypothetical protein